MQTSLFTTVLDDLSLENAIKATAEAGYDAVEIKGRKPHLTTETSMETVRELRELLRQVELPVSCLYTGTGGYVNKSHEECEAELVELQA